MLELCPKCRGTKRFSEMGFMETSCGHCDSKGYLEDNEPVDPILEDMPFEKAATCLTDSEDNLPEESSIPSKKKRARY